jgi:DNA-binding NtrC family response regulator
MAAVMDRAVLIGQGRSLAVAAALGQVPTSSAPAAGGPIAEADPPGTIAPLNDVMKRHIEHALRHTQGRIEGVHGAARVLRINPHTLRARMRKLKIDWQKFRGEGRREEGERPSQESRT